MKKRITENNLFIYIPVLIILLISIFVLGKHSLDSHMLKQILWIIIGLVIFFIIKRFKIKLLFAYSHWIYLFNVFLLILVLFIGKEINGAKAWFDFKYFSFQPSELMKISLALYLYKIISYSNPQNLKEELLLITKIAFIFLLPAILVFLEPDTGAIILYFIITFVALYYAKIRRYWFILLIGLLICFLVAFFCLYYGNQDLLIKLVGTSFFYRVDRLISFANNSGYQINQALIAIGSAGLYGKKHSLYIPEATTDFIFAFMISRFGFIIAIILLNCYFLIDIYFIKLILKTKNPFISMFFFMFLFQQIQNILMNIGLFPIMGIPLPFLSYGGTNTIIYFIFLGIILNIKKVRNFSF
ncbi:MAG: FtsW/RodA/SpoVE family cell cycle protein [Bacilli bacterium]|nr:FtsW/RodA/SpoVE family cell cycle protein [Bacilli bacterium]